MDFFAAQDRARASSRRLVWWFILCVISVVVAIYGAAVILVTLTSTGEDVTNSTIQWWQPQLAIILGPLISGIIMSGSLYKLSQLSSGGAVVARDLGGRAVSRSTREPLERRLVNVVDEMAIACGLPSPDIWVLDEEQGINAFAAGTDPSNAVIGVTRGCLERLDRDELQGVVAHEFSHILNGDMKLNQRLMGWIFGLLMISMMGRGMLRVLENVRIRNSKDSGGVLLVIVVSGIILWAVGSLGVLFARMLQAAVSREREFLADASAVQFTRNPSGIGDALKKIGGSGGAVTVATAMEARHFFFTNSGGFSLGFATHPPLADRIRAIDPGWDGKMIRTGRTGGKPEIRYRKPQKLVSEPAFAADPGNTKQVDAVVGVVIHQRLTEKGMRLETKDQAKFLVIGMLMAADGRAEPAGPNRQGMTHCC